MQKISNTMPKKNLSKTHPISETLNILREIKNKEPDLIQELIPLLFHHNSEELHLGLAVIAEPDEAFDLFYNTILCPHLAKIKDSTKSLENVFSNTPVINEEQHEKHLELLIEEIFPEHMHLEILHKIKMLSIEI